LRDRFKQSSCLTTHAGEGACDPSRFALSYPPVQVK
jgi:hypothetical protein